MTEELFTNEIPEETEPEELNDETEELETEPESGPVLPDERSAEVEINGETYRLLYTNGAMLAFEKELGGLGRYIDQLKGKEISIAEIMPDTMKALRILINQGIMFDNLAAGTKRDLVTDEWLLLNTNPGDVVDLRNATMAAITRGMHRNVRSDPEKKHKAE